MTKDEIIREIIIKKMLRNDLWEINDCVQMLVESDDINGSFDEIKATVINSIKAGLLTPHSSSRIIATEELNQREFLFLPKAFLIWAKQKKYVIPDEILKEFFDDILDYNYWLLMSTWTIKEAAFLLCGFDYKPLSKDFLTREDWIVCKVYEILKRARDDTLLYDYDEKYGGYNRSDCKVAPSEKYTVITYLRFWQDKLKNIIDLPKVLKAYLEEKGRYENSKLTNSPLNILQQAGDLVDKSFEKERARLKSLTEDADIAIRSGISAVRSKLQTISQQQAGVESFTHNDLQLDVGECPKVKEEDLLVSHSELEKLKTKFVNKGTNQSQNVMTIAEPKVDSKTDRSSNRKIRLKNFKPIHYFFINVIKKMIADDTKNGTRICPKSVWHRAKTEKCSNGCIQTMDNWDSNTPPEARIEWKDDPAQTHSNSYTQSTFTKDFPELYEKAGK